MTGPPFSRNMLTSWSVSSSVHHLTFSYRFPGQVLVKEKSDSTPYLVNLLKDDWTPSSTDLPEVVKPSGLSPARQWYLYNKIREFCPDDSKDATCPRPTVPEPSAATSRGTCKSNQSTVSTPTTASTPATVSTPATLGEPARKKPRLCGICREEGHNSRSCPSKTVAPSYT